MGLQFSPSLPDWPGPRLGTTNEGCSRRSWVKVSSRDISVHMKFNSESQLLCSFTPDTPLSVMVPAQVPTPALRGSTLWHTCLHGRHGAPSPPAQQTYPSSWSGLCPLCHIRHQGAEINGTFLGHVIGIGNCSMAVAACGRS